jgi:hypothetical protein
MDTEEAVVFSGMESESERESGPEPLEAPKIVAPQGEHAEEIPQKARFTVSKPGQQMVMGESDASGL